MKSRSSYPGHMISDFYNGCKREERVGGVLWGAVLLRDVLRVLSCALLCRSALHCTALCCAALRREAVLSCAVLGLNTLGNESQYGAHSKRTQGPATCAPELRPLRRLLIT